MEELHVGLLGFGTVGSGMLKVLRDNATSIEARLGARLDVSRVAVRDKSKERPIEFPADRITEDAMSVLEDPKISIIVELVGGVDEAADYVLEAIRRGKHVVTANKALLAARGKEVFDAASEHGVDVFYEGAVCGGIPIIRALRESFASERIQSIVGIVNGTTNFILSEMSERGLGFEEALAEAQRLGFAEADPTADVEGHDAAQKLVILASLGFGARVRTDDVSTEGIRNISAEDIRFAKSHGYQIKSIGVAERIAGDDPEALAMSVQCAWVPDSSPLAHVDGPYNAVLIRSEALGDSLFYGQGAGQLPTGSAVASDVIDVARNIRIGATGRVPHLATRDEALSRAVVQSRSSPCPYFLRFAVHDRPGVLGRIATCLGEKGVSLRLVHQEIEGQGEVVPIYAITHPARPVDVSGALETIDGFGVTQAKTRAIRIFDA